MNTQEKTPYQNEVDALLEETEAKMKDLHAKYPLEKEQYLYDNEEEEQEKDKETAAQATEKMLKTFVTIAKGASNNLSELNFSLKFHQSNTPDFGALLEGPK